MVKDDNVYLGHMLDMARKAVALVAGRSQDDFDADESFHFAVAHIVQTIGEAANRVSISFRDAHPEIPWRSMVGIRNRIVHDYMFVDYDILWAVATHSLPPLIVSLERQLPPAER